MNNIGIIGAMENEVRTLISLMEVEKIIEIASL